MNKGIWHNTPFLCYKTQVTTYLLLKKSELTFINKDLLIICQINGNILRSSIRIKTGNKQYFILTGVGGRYDISHITFAIDSCIIDPHDDESLVDSLFFEKPVAFYTFHFNTA